MVSNIAEGLYTFSIPLPENPLKQLNCYVIPSGDRSLLIDTGFNRPECRQALRVGIEELGLDLKKTDVLLTHLHSDHCGGAEYLQSLGARILMGETDAVIDLGGTLNRRIDAMRRNGMPEETITAALESNPGRKYAPDVFKVDVFLHDGDTLRCGAYELEVIETPGHTPGNLCLYERTKKLLFSSDHVLFDITPNITSWLELEDSLGTYLNSLARIGRLEVETALPGHRSVNKGGFPERVEALRRHHSARLAEACSILSGGPMSCYELAGHMSWRISANNWDAFPPGQKWFAVGEAQAHLEHLMKKGLVSAKAETDGVYLFSLI